MPNYTIGRFTPLFSHLPLALATLALLIGGSFLLHRSDAEARDTIRKHHLYDIEQALYFTYRQHGTYPPYDEPTWCGVLQDPGSEPVRREIEAALRQVIEKYANAAKPFPMDPLIGNSEGPAPRSPVAQSALRGEVGYFYWKRSPAVFELYSLLEAAPTGERNSQDCAQTAAAVYDYGINSRLRYE